jgi:hypothetical protein
VNVVLSWLVAEDEGSRKKIREELLQRNETLEEDLKESLQGKTHTQTPFPSSPPSHLEKRKRAKQYRNPKLTNISPKPKSKS